MFSTRWQLFRVFGIPIRLDMSWLIILCLLTWTFASQVFASNLPNLGKPELWGLGLITAVAFFLCILLHELGHALVARPLGIPINGITLFLFGGVAEMAGEPLSPGGEFLMAVAGPLVSLVLGVVFLMLGAVGEKVHWGEPVILVLQSLASINFLVLVFNLIPAFPLDGGRIFRSILWALLGNLRRATRWASYLGQGFAWVMIGIGLVLLFHMEFFNGIWLGLIGWFLLNAAQGSYQQVLIQQALQGEPVKRFMNPNPIVVPPTLDLYHLVEDYVYRYHRKRFPVASDGRLEGYIDTRDVATIPRREWDQHQVAEVMQHDYQAVSIGPDADALQALRKMQRTGSSRLLVTNGEQLVGMISLKDLLRFLDLKLRLEHGEE